MDVRAYVYALYMDMDIYQCAYELGVVCFIRWRFIYKALASGLHATCNGIDGSEAVGALGR